MWERNRGRGRALTASSLKKKVSLLLKVFQTSLLLPICLPTCTPQAFPAPSSVSVGYAYLHVMLWLVSAPIPLLRCVSLPHGLSRDLFCSSSFCSLDSTRVDRVCSSFSDRLPELSLTLSGPLQAVSKAEGSSFSQLHGVPRRRCTQPLMHASADGQPPPLLSEL